MKPDCRDKTSGPDAISVCVCTLRRTEILCKLLERLKRQHRSGLFDYSVIVIDNDAAGSARETVMNCGVIGAGSVIYQVEPVQTIPAARNHAVRLAKGDYIAIIDDDELPPSDWLLTMYRAVQTFGVDGALGPVHPFFEQRPPDWLLQGRFCERPVVRTGTLLHWSQTRTGNVLLKRDVFDRDGLSFDERMTTGGSDQEFFRQAMRRGRRFVAVAEAPVYEVVPPERWKKAYWLRRALVNGFNAHTYTKDRLRGPVWVLQFFRLLVSAGICLAAVPIAACAGTHRIMQVLEKGLHHFSRLCAMVGIELVKKRSF
jgi:glycosyltransferase involved in cell wall biosynthesis